MNFALQDLEKRFLSSNIAAELPPTWQVIYQEGIRGNHILFAENDVQIFQNQMANLIEEGADKEEDKVVDSAYQVMTAASFESMYEVISSVSIEIRMQLFFVYQRLLLVWAQYLKLNLH
jgi:hypothetical protein